MFYIFKKYDNKLFINMNNLNSNDIKINSTNDFKKISADIIDLLKKNFDFIKNHNDLACYFEKFIDLPMINWLAYNSKLVGYNCLLIDNFIYNGKLVKAGRPELDSVSLNFLKYCKDNKIDYALLNPMKILHDAVINQAKELHLKFLYSWPNRIAQPSYIKYGYSIKDIKIKTYTKIISANYFKKKKINRLIGLILQPFNLIHKFIKMFNKKIIFEKVDDFAIEKINIQEIWDYYCKKNEYSVYPNKANPIINKRFNDKKFEKHILKYKNKVIGYAVLKTKTDENNIRYIWVADYFVNDKYLYPLLNSISSMDHDAIQCRFFSTSHIKINSLLMLLNGFIIKTTQNKKFNYILFDESMQAAFSEMQIDDFITDFSM
jgi:hypothetical protein